MSKANENQQEPLTVSLEDEHYPSLYRSADRASLSAQRRHLRLQKWHIGCLIFGSVGAAFSTSTPIVAVTWAYVVLAIVLAVGIILTWVSRVRRDDKVWYDCRAIAESTKTVAWRFMMRAAPFKDDSTAKVLFIDQLRRIRKARPSTPINWAYNRNADFQSITSFMVCVRQKPAKEHQELYLESRLRDQKMWYLNKIKVNSAKENRWFWAVVVLQILAVSFAIIRACSAGLPVNPLPLLLTLTACAIAWSQLKRYSELAQSYSVAVQELGDQEAIALDIEQEDAFLTLVEQVEETVSREHTMWCARRDVIIDPTHKEN